MIILSSNYAVCYSKKTRFIKKQEAIEFPNPIKFILGSRLDLGII